MAALKFPLNILETAAFLLAGVLLTFLAFAEGCHGTRTAPIAAIVTPPPVTQIAPPATAEHRRVESLEAEADRLRGELDSAEARIKTARAAEREARLSGVRMLVTWLTAICTLVGILSVGAFVFLRVKTLLVVTAACAAMVVAAQASNVLLDHPLIASAGLSLIVAGVVAAIWWKQIHTQRGLAAAVQIAEALKPEPTVESAVDRMERRVMQSKIIDSAGAGALHAIETVRAKINQLTGT